VAGRASTWYIHGAAAEGALQVELSNAHRVIVWPGCPTCLALSGTCFLRIHSCGHCSALPVSALPALSSRFNDSYRLCCWCPQVVSLPFCLSLESPREGGVHVQGAFHSMHGALSGRGMPYWCWRAVRRHSSGSSCCRFTAPTQRRITMEAAVR